jgi:hypothetical protein
MDAIARRAFERPNLEALAAGGDAGQPGFCLARGAKWSMNDHDASPWIVAGALQNSQSPVDTEGAVMDAILEFTAIPPLVNFAHFRKLITRSAPDCGLSQRPGDAVRAPIARLMVGSA